MEREFNELQTDINNFDEQKQNLEMTLLQSNDTLNRYNYPTADENSGFIEKLSFNYQQAITALNDMSSIRKAEGEFFLTDGRKVTGEITHVGQIAALGNSSDGEGLLAPAGNGRLQIWTNESGASVSSNEFHSPVASQVFLFESAEKDLAATEEKKWTDTLKAGGSIGWVITALGLTALLTIIIRATFLRFFQNNHNKTEDLINSRVDSADREDLVKEIKQIKGGTARLIELALSNVKSSKYEDIVAEGFIEHSTKLDRFNTFILVVSAVAPLLGLLGTVTGMIATFDIITEVGTGDPKLLSSGISEALVTTMFGLIVAIPALLLGNLLSSWSEAIKGEMEKLVLKVSNRFDHA